MKKHTFQISVLFSVILLLLFQQCPTQPDDPDPAEPGRRDYIWTVDTLTVPYNDTFYPRRMWGSAADDVWLVGRGSTTRLLWHFDGTEWQTDSVYRALSPSALWGFASDDIWLGNLGNVFWHYNGYSWSKYSKVTPPEGYDITSIEGLWGSNPSDVWGVGFATNLTTSASRGIIMHFDGSEWNFQPIPSLPVSFIRIREQRSSHRLVLEAWRTEQTLPDTFKIYTYDGKNTLKEIYSSVEYMTFSQIKGEIYFVSQQKVFTYADHEFVLWKDFSGTRFGNRIIGRSAKDFFCETRDGTTLHYNGADLVQVYKAPRQPIARFLFENDVFFVCHEYATDLITVIHGHLPTE